MTQEVFVHLSEPNLIQGPDGDGVTGTWQDRSMSCAPFAFSGTVVVEVTKLFGDPASRDEISPKAYGIDPHAFDGRTVKFQLTNLPGRPEYLSVNFEAPDNRDEGRHGGDKTSFMKVGEDGLLDGFIIENPTHHAIPSGKRTTMRRVKIIGWASNHDGIRPAPRNWS